jgi:hypothetical protein
MLHYTLLHHSSSARLTSDTRLYREAGITEKRWHITNQNNGTGYSKDRHNDVAVMTIMIGQKASRRVRWGHFNYRHMGDINSSSCSIIFILKVVSVRIYLILFSKQWFDKFICDNYYLVFFYSFIVQNLIDQDLTQRLHTT